MEETCQQTVRFARPFTILSLEWRKSYNHTSCHYTYYTSMKNGKPYQTVPIISWPRFPPNPSSRIGASISRADRDDWPPDVEGCGSFSFSSAIWSTDGPSLNNRFACRTQTGTPYSGQTPTLSKLCGYTKFISLFKIMCTLIQECPIFQMNK